MEDFTHHDSERDSLPSEERQPNDLLTKMRTLAPRVAGVFSRIPPVASRLVPRRLKTSLTTQKQRTKNRFNNLEPQERYIVGLLALIVIGSLFALAVQVYLNNTRAIPALGGEYREAAIGTPHFINPVLASTDIERAITSLVYPSLMRYNAKGELVPSIAETYEVTDEGKTYRFKLKEGLVWEDGTPLTAEDVAFTIQRVQDAQFSSPVRANWQNVVVSTEGTDRVILRLPSPYAPFLENATVGILPKHRWENISAGQFPLDDANLQPIGAGSFVFEKFTQTKDGELSSYTVKRNERYHGTQPFLSRITFKFFSSELDAIEAYNARSVDGIASVSPANLEHITQQRGTAVHAFSMPRYFALFFNPEENAILEDGAVRNALLAATDRQAIIDDILLGYARLIDTPVPPTLKDYYNNDVSAVPFNPDEARRLLIEAGWLDEDGDGIREKVLTQGQEPTPLSIQLTTLPVGELEAVARRVSEQWKAVGVRLEVTTVNVFILQQDILRDHAYESFLFGEILALIPDPYPFWHSSQTGEGGLNLAQYKNKEVDAILEKARQTVDENERITQYKTFQEKVAQDVPAIFLYDPSYLYIVNESVGGITPTLIAEPAFRFVEVEKWYRETRRIF